MARLVELVLTDHQTQQQKRTIMNNTSPESLRAAADALEAINQVGITQPATNRPDMWDDLVGTKVLIRTVTMTTTGRVERVDDSTILLSDAAWIADTGRFANALETGVLAEVEPYPNDGCYVSRGAIVDFCLWNHDLPTEQK